MAAPEHAPDAAARDHATVQQVAVGWLRRAIARGELAPGERIVQESAAEQIGVSLIPVREALRILETEGLVTYRPRRGYVVTELDLDDLVEIYRLRHLLEADAVARGLPRARPADIERIAAAADECREAAAAGDVAAQLAANRRFHLGLYALAGSTHLERHIGMLWDATEAYRALYYVLPGEREASDQAHTEILAAVRAADVEACIGALDAHRERALRALAAALPGPASAARVPI